MKKTNTLVNKWVELSYIEDCKTLQKYGLSEYYNKVNQSLYEFINPQLSYDYEEVNMPDNQKMWKVKKQGNDPQFVITIKNTTGEDNWKALDFYFHDVGFDKQSGLEGKHYLDTLGKVIKDEIIPYFSSYPELVLFFEPYTHDGGGETRKKVFKRMIDKFVDKNKFDVQIEGNDQEFIISRQDNKYEG